MFSYADRLMRDMNRRNLRAFDRLKLIPIDEVNAAVSEVYENAVKLAKKRFLMIALEAYAEAMKELGKDETSDITEDWILDMLEDYDPVTLYRFIPEADRKKQRLIEAIIAANNKAEQIDKALKAWTLQIAHYADRSVIDATVKAYKDAGVKKVMWVAVDDEKTCQTCGKRDGKVYPINKIPDRPHYRCRCYLEPM